MSLRQLIACHKVIEKSVETLEHDLRKLRGDGANWEKNISVDERESIKVLYQLLQERREKLNKMLDTKMSFEEGLL
jgi:hypothetical protein